MNGSISARGLSRAVWLVLLVFITLGCQPSDPAAETNVVGPSDVRMRIAVIPKSTAHVFWNSVEAGARQAAEELDVDIIWKAPISERDRSEQIKLVQQMTTDRVDGIVLAPLDSRALVGPVRAASHANVPVVIIDSGLEAEQGQDFVSFVATDNTLGGQLGGKKLAEILEQQGNVVLLRYNAGSASTSNREEGFLAAIGNHPAIQVISENQYAGTTTGEAQTTALNMIDTLKQANGIFCPNESSTEGMLLALRKEGLGGQRTFVGFDASPPLVQALQSGEIDALVVQNPFQMGYLGVKTIVAHLRGETVEPVIDTGATVVTRENMNDPAIKPLLP
jgi:ribose transport system substrate-binding protein